MDLRRVGRAVRVLRRRRGWRQRDLGAAAGVSASSVSRLEAGRSGVMSLRVLEHIVRKLGGDLVVLVRWQGADLDRLIDERHARVVERVVRLLRSLGWEVIVEVSFSIHGERGSIDVVGRHTSGALVIVEVKATIGQAHDTLSTLDRKARLAPAIARERGWSAAPLGVLLVVEESRTNRRRIADHAAMFSAALPARTRDVRAWLEDPRGPMRGIAFLSAVRTVHASTGSGAPSRAHSERSRTHADPGPVERAPGARESRRP